MSDLDSNSTQGLPQDLPREHALVDFMAERGQANSAAPADVGARIELQPFRCHINLRGDPSNASFVSACEHVIGQALPSANQFSHTTSIPSSVFWLGPNEWLIVSQASSLTSQLSEALAGQHCSVTDTSGGQIALQFSGEHAREVLNKGCTLDLHPRAFAPGQCAQSGLGKASMLVGLIDAAPTFQLIIRRSFADYAARWLDHASAEYGVVWC